eukprot:340440_1
MMLALCLSFVAITVRSGNICSYIAVDGIGYPTNECFYHEEVNAANPNDTFVFSWSVSCKGDDDIILRYWAGVDSCEGTPDLVTPNNYCSSSGDGLGGQMCQCVGRGSACDRFTFGTTDTGADECAYVAEERISVVVNECIATGFGSSQRFSCDDTHVTLEEFPSTEDCTGEGSYEEIDYTGITDEECVYAECTSGTRIKRRCKKPPADLTPILMGRMQSQRLFIQNLRAQHHETMDWNGLMYYHVAWVLFVVIVLAIACIGCVIRKRGSEFIKI